MYEVGNVQGCQRQTIVLHNVVPLLTRTIQKLLELRLHRFCCGAVHDLSYVPVSDHINTHIGIQTTLGNLRQQLLSLTLNEILFELYKRLVLMTHDFIFNNPPTKFFSYMHPSNTAIMGLMILKLKN